MIDASTAKQHSLIDEYCLQLGLLVERRHTERALVYAREQALEAARLAKQAMREAQAADRSKAKFLGNMTHELRTPLNAIIGFSEIIEGAPGQLSTADYARYIRDSGTHLLGILNGVLDLARIEAGKLALDEQVVELAELIEAVLRPARIAAAEKGLTVDAACAGDTSVRIDAGKMSQAIGNVLANAVKFTPSGGHVELRGGIASDGGLQFTVRDTGCGIPEELLSKVLEPFGQVEEHLTRENDGIGLGLPIASALIRLHGGEIVLSSKEGDGTTAEIRLPAARVERRSRLSS